MDTKVNNNGIKYVDLDLPSGTLWATRNIGANKPNDAGFYFQWGEVTGYNQWSIRFDNTCDGLTWGKYKWYLCGHGYDDTLKFKKYTKPGDTLELEDDAAHMIMGGDWHIPSPKQIQELIDNTTSAWTTLDDVIGITFISKKDSSKSIFIPAAGCALNSTIYNRKSAGYIWSSALKNGKHSYDGNILKFWPGHVTLDSYNRVYGLPIRGVIDRKCDNKNNNSKNNTTMNEDLNLVKILKNVSKGTKLWSPYGGECSFIGIEHANIDTIKCKVDDTDLYFFSDGTMHINGECMLFPSKENRDWSTFKALKKHFEPFQKVLIKIRIHSKTTWIAAVYSHYDSSHNKHYLTNLLARDDKDIIPYEGNKDKLGKITDRL